MKWGHASPDVWLLPQCGKGAKGMRNYENPWNVRPMPGTVLGIGVQI